MNRESRALVYPTALFGRDRARVARSYSVDASGCWIALNKPHSGRYSSFYAQHHRFQLHRLMYVLTHGAIPAAWDVDHLCRVTRCVNPAHLEAVTHAENIRRGLPTGPRRAAA